MTMTDGASSRRGATNPGEPDPSADRHPRRCVVRAAGGKKIAMLTILLIVLIVLVLAGGFGYGGGRYRSGGIGLGTILLIILLVLLLTGGL